ncbi:hypothetical protein INS49_007071 [Diaporthe citri]|uniref:uncharacterized protein n=1 Tax=Diaporthe citri TaxID=83186 RepID=UPI001C7F175E|nr:uncharacterized protein INS49_007071 [Diaporthe citri]KAG6365460.1 hypothetical protein INS49_007071 [Diaporthe citri]
MASSFPNPRRLLVSNRSNGTTKDQAEPGVEALVDTLEPVAVMPKLNRAPIATHAAIPTSNAEAGRPHLDTVPGSGIVLPGGANIYYLDLTPHSDSPMRRITPLTAPPDNHRTPSTDHVIVLRGELTVVTPPVAFDVVDGKGSYTKVGGDGCTGWRRGGPEGVLANRSEDSVRLIGIVLAAEPVKIEVAGEAKELGESWLQ